MRAISSRRAPYREPPGLSRRVVATARALPSGGAEPRRSPAATGSASARFGATLTEVLMAVLILGVGVVSVFTLFPISVLRTIQATNQTNAKILKENAEEQLSQSPVLLTEFSPSVNPAPASPIAGLTMRGEWQPATPYPANTVIVPTIKPGTAVPRPIPFFVIAAPGTSGLVEPIWNPQAASISDGGVTWVRFQLNSYVVDPLGLNIARRDGQSASVVDTFGNKTNRVTATATALAAGPLLRIHGGRTHPTDPDLALLQAADTCTAPDSWQQVLQAVPTTVAANSATFANTVDLGGIGGSTLAAPRIVLTSLDGSQTVVRRITGIAAPTVSWSAAEPLPARFPAGDVGQARIEIFNRRYAWFLTVRNVGARPEIKCVVTFNRSGNTAEEHVYAANFGNPDIDANGNSAVDSADGLTNPSQVMIAWQPGAATAWDPEGTGANANEPDPLLKTGNWLFDARDASWYRIQSVDNSDLSATPRWAVLTLDQSVRVVTPDDGTGPPANPQPIGRAILMPGIVDVFDL